MPSGDPQDLWKTDFDCASSTAHERHQCWKRELFGSSHVFNPNESLKPNTRNQAMKITIAAIAACFAAVTMTAPAMADSLTIKVNPNPPAKRIVVTPQVKRVVIKKPCYDKTVKKIMNNKTVITKTRVCP
jgi:hypothetical protein